MYSTHYYYYSKHSMEFHLVTVLSLILEYVKYFKGFHTLICINILTSFFHKVINCKFSHRRDFSGA